MPRKANWESAAILFFLGAPHVVIGVVFVGWLPQRMAAKIAQIDALPVVALDALPPVGSSAILEGRLSDRATPASADLPLIYDEYQRSVSEGETEWQQVHSQRPTVWLQTGNRWAKVMGDYRLAEGSIEQVVGDRRLVGLRQGDPVVVVGTVTETEDPPTVTATVISAGTKNQYLTFLRETPRMPRWFGGIFLTCGLVLWGLAGAFVVRPWQQRKDET